MPLYRGRALYGQLPSARNTCPTDPSLAQGDYEEAEELDARERYERGWAEAHYEDTAPETADER